MKTYVNGVSIELTGDQVKQVNKEMALREKCRISFSRMLNKFGFKATDKKYPLCMSNETFGWYAEIIDRGNYSDVWMTGDGLKTSGFPGGWIYSEPKEIEDEIVRVLELKK